MKNNFLYYCLAISLIIHLLIVMGIRLEKPEKKEKEPIVVDVMGPLKWGQKTVLPVGKKPPETKTAALKPTERHAVDRPSRPLARLAPSFPSIPVPVPQAAQPRKAPPPSAGLPPAPGDIASPSPPGQGGTAKAQAVPSPPQSARRGLMLPSREDLEKYAKADTEEEKRHPDSVTLDTDDLMYTSYLQGLKRRIELIWKYPETARRDGLQGSLIMRFSIGKSGKLENVEVLRSSGYPMLDEAATQALKDANPYNPLPDNWKKDSFTITGTFVYKIYGLYLR